MASGNDLKRASQTAANEVLSINNDVADLLSSVMGPDYANSAKALMSAEIAEEIKQAISGTITGDKVDKMMAVISKRLILPASKEVKKNNKDKVKSIADSVKEAATAASEIAKIASKGIVATTTMAREEAIEIIWGGAQPVKYVVLIELCIHPQ